MATSLEKFGINQFNGKNFDNWKFRVSAVLDQQEVLECTKINQTDPDENLKKNDKKCKSIIIACLSDSYLEYVKDKDTAYDMWKSLATQFERKSMTNQLYLRRKLLSTKLLDNESLENHFIKFDEIIRELKAVGANLEETDIVCHLLLTLPKSFDNICTALETMESSKLTLEYVKSKLLDQEVKRRMNVESKNEPSAAFGMNTNKYKKQSKPKQHVVEEKKDYFKFNCHGCGRKGHKVAQCRYKDKNNFKSQANHNESTPRESSDNTKVAFMIADTVSSRVNKSCIYFYLDSGATDHLVNDNTCFEKVCKLKEPVIISVAKSNENCTATEIGNIQIVLENQELEMLGEIKNVLFVKDLRHNLLSVPKLTKAGINVNFSNDKAVLTRNNQIIGIALKSTNNLYRIKFDIASENKVVNICKIEQNTTQLWHRRLGHISYTYLQKMAQEKLIPVSTNTIIAEKENVCDVCVKSKQTKATHSQIISQRSHRPLQLIHSDVCGPITPETHDEKKYILTLIDDYTHMIIIYLLKNKSEVFEYFKQYEAFITNHFERKIGILRCDNGGEYTSKEFQKFCCKKGIKMQYTTKYTPQLNGVAERANRTLIEKVRAMLVDSQLPKNLWGEAALCATYVLNRSITTSLPKGTIPAEIFYKRKVNLSKLKPFGCLAYNHIPKERRTKLDDKSELCIMVGYTDNGYRLWNPTKLKIETGSNIIFDETRNLNNVNNKEVQINIQTEIEKTSNKYNLEEENTREIQEIQEIGENIPPETETRRSERNKKPPAYLKDYEIDNGEEMAHLALCTEVLEDVPKNLREAQERNDSHKWMEAVECEIASLNKNETWTIVERPQNTKIIDSRWVFKIKKDEYGNNFEYKARLVAKGYMQKRDFDFSETYAPVAKLSTFRFLLAIAVNENMLCEQMDVKSAFLHGKLKEKIYMNLPEGHKMGNKVCKLNKTLYGLKQSPHCWNSRFDQFMKDIFFKSSEYDPCLYLKVQNHIKVYILLYVDDLIIVSNSQKEINGIKLKLSEEFEMKDLGGLTYFLGIKISIMPNQILLDQSAYLARVLDRFGMKDCKPSKTPSDSKLDISLIEESPEITEHVPYRELIGCLMYAIMGTRPDLSACVNFYSRYQDKPVKRALWTGLKKVLRYIKGTINYGLVFVKLQSVSPQKLICYVDASWASDLNDRKSTTGYLFKVFNCLIVWNTKKQPTVSLSSTEAEYIALAAASAEGVWLIGLLKEFGYEKMQINCFEDNQSCIKLTEKCDHKRLKHVDVKYNFIRNLVKDNILVLNYLPSQEQIADVMTKCNSNLVSVFCKNVGLICHTQY